MLSSFGARSSRLCLSALSKQSIAIRSFRFSPIAHADAVKPVEPEKEPEPEPEPASPPGRYQVMAEVTVSKIFPAGFGWQTSSIIADNSFGFAADSLKFALTTGFGDAVGVLLGHSIFYGIKKAVVSPDINMVQEVQTGTMLACAAFCSGTAWQPVVNVLQGLNLSFGAVFTGTWVACGSAFYLGLRLSRTILSGYMDYIIEPTYENHKNDASLSMAIGGATAFFVGTDAGYLPDQNFLIDIVGIVDGTPDLTGCAIAGSSTALGFLAAQTPMNIIYPKGKCWNG